MPRLFALVACLLAPPAAAGEAEIARLYDALRLDEVVAVMQDEGLRSGGDLQDELFPGHAGAAWDGVLREIYAIDRMEAFVRRGFETALNGVDLDPLLAFYTSGRGAEIVALEVEARRVMQDEAVAEAAEARAFEMQADGEARMRQIDDLVEVNDLIEENVVGALNANYAFYAGLAAGGAFPDAPTEDDLLADVWAQETEIRADAIDWIYGYLALAYQPLSDEDLRAYVELSRSAGGQALNDAIFAAFNAMYTTISRQLGREAAAFMVGEDV